MNSLVYEDVNDDGDNDIILNVTYIKERGEIEPIKYTAKVICINEGYYYFEDPIFNPIN